MGLAEVAAEAVTFAKEAFAKGVRIETMVEFIQKSGEAFENRISTGMEEFRRSVSASLNQAEQRAEDRQRDVDKRLREFESRMAKLEGAVTGKLVEVIASQQLRDHGPKDGSSVAQLIAPPPNDA